MMEIALWKVVKRMKTTEKSNRQQDQAVRGEQLLKIKEGFRTRVSWDTCGYVWTVFSVGHGPQCRVSMGRTSVYWRWGGALGPAIPTLRFQMAPRDPVNALSSSPKPDLALMTPPPPTPCTPCCCVEAPILINS